MAENATIIGLVALSTAIFTGVGLILKHVRHSECMRGCCEIDTRSPNRESIIEQPHKHTLAPPPTPQQHHKRTRLNAESHSDDNEEKNEEKKSEFNLDIIDTDV